MKVLVTGGAGFIGSHLCDRLLAEGWSVTCLDSFDDHYPREIKEANIRQALEHESFDLVEGDIRDEALLDRLFAEGRAESVVHLAARPGPRPSLENPGLYYGINVLGTLSVLEACRRHGLRSLVFSSSSSVYGLNTEMPFAEDDPINRPASPYAATKAAAEHLCHTYAHAHGLPITVVRLFTVYGPRQRPDMAMHKFARKILAGEPIDVYGDGSSVRDYTYVGDVVDALLRLLAEPRETYEVFNIAGGGRVELREVIVTLERVLGREAVLQHRPPQVGDVPATWGDVGKARRQLGFSPSTSIEEGMRRLCDTIPEMRRQQP